MCHMQYLLLDPLNTWGLILINVICKDSDLVHTEQIVHPLGIPLGDRRTNKEWLFLIIT